MTLLPPLWLLLRVPELIPVSREERGRQVCEGRVCCVWGVSLVSEPAQLRDLPWSLLTNTVVPWGRGPFCSVPALASTLPSLSLGSQ